MAAIFGKRNFRNIGFDPGSAFVSIGLVINAVISFLAVAFILFVSVQASNKTQDPKVEGDPGPSEIDLLAEIRDAMKAYNG